MQQTFVCMVTVSHIHGRTDSEDGTLSEKPFVA